MNYERAKIAIPIFIKPGVDLEEVLHAAAEAGADSIELRCDSAGEKLMLEAIDEAPLPVIVTVRPTWEGGYCKLADAKRIELFEAAIEAGADYIDVELVAWEKSRDLRDRLTAAAEKAGTRLIISHHDFSGRPKDLAERLARLRTIKAASILKIAWKAESILCAIDALRLTREHAAKDRRPLLVLTMGEEGVISRLLGAKFGMPLTFATIEAAGESAPGQPSVCDLRELYRWDQQRADTPVFGVIGWPVGHSLSPHIHNAGFAAVNVAGVYVPLAIKPEYAAFAAALDAARDVLDLRGVSVTIPHKENALRYVRERGGAVDALADRIGVVNTVVWDGTANREPRTAIPAHPERERRAAAAASNTARSHPANSTLETRNSQFELRGFNTDYPGALEALVEAMGIGREQLRSVRVAVLGAGGAARAIVAALAASGAQVTIYNRTLSRAEALAAEFATADAPVVAAAWEALSAARAQVFINCTPIGMHPKVKDSPIDPAHLPAWDAETVVFDTVYNPYKTRLLQLAEQRGAKIVTGAEMFVRQAAGQFAAFTGKEAPLEIFRQVMLNRLGGGRRLEA